MTKDYANKRYVRPAKSRARYVNSSSTDTPAWFWMGAGLMLGLILSGMVFWKFHTNKPFSAQHEVIFDSKPALTSKTPIKNKPKVTNASEKPSPRFDFYTLLPNMTMEVPDLKNSEEMADEPIQSIRTAEEAEDQTALAAATHALPTTEPTTQTATEPAASPAPVTSLSSISYFIQAGSFRQLSQAEALKAQLALSGNQASIQTFKMDNKDTRYRVFLGPFSTKEQATIKKQQLDHSHRLHSLVVKNRV